MIEGNTCYTVAVADIRPQYHASVPAADAPVAAPGDDGIMRIIELFKQPALFVIASVAAAGVIAIVATMLGQSMIAGMMQPLAALPTP